MLTKTGRLKGESGWEGNALAINDWQVILTSQGFDPDEFSMETTGSDNDYATISRLAGAKGTSDVTLDSAES